MPLTPLPQDNTKRYFVEMAVGTIQHYVQVRCTDAITDAAAIANLAADFTALLPALGNNVTIPNLYVAVRGSNVRNLVSGWTNLTGTQGGDCLNQRRARSHAFSGRTPGGRKAKMLIWGVMESEDANFIFPVPASGALRNFFTAFTSRASMYLGIDGTQATWHERITEDMNDHWIKALRKTG